MTNIQFLPLFWLFQFVGLCVLCKAGKKHERRLVCIAHFVRVTARGRQRAVRAHIGNIALTSDTRGGSRCKSARQSNGTIDGIIFGSAAQHPMASEAAVRYTKRR